jgi:thioredoxin reductase
MACTKAPDVFHAMPSRFRVGVVDRFLGPAPGWFVRDRVEAAVSVHTNAQLVDVAARDDGVVLTLSSGTSVGVDHAIAATGYKVDLGRLPFLHQALRRKIRVVNAAPALSRSFESSVPGLFFVGASAAYSLGPLMRFACGAQFAARRVARRLS